MTSHPDDNEIIEAMAQDAHKAARAFNPAILPWKEISAYQQETLRRAYAAAFAVCAAMIRERDARIIEGQHTNSGWSWSFRTSGFLVADSNPIVKFSQQAAAAIRGQEPTK